jgi:REP element-mobilizing transposase RayT
VALEKFQFKIEKQFRLKNWDYSSSGFYFITICTHEHTNYFGEIKNNKIELNKIGKIVSQNWVDIPNHFPDILLDEFIIMPNHLHGILVIKNNFSLKINKPNQNNPSCRNMPWHVPTNYLY